MSEFDHMTLSAYLDGELDPATMREVKTYIDRDADTRRYVLDALHTNVLLRASGRHVLDEAVPGRWRTALGRRDAPRPPLPCAGLLCARR